MWCVSVCAFWLPQNVPQLPWSIMSGWLIHSKMHFKMVHGLSIEGKVRVDAGNGAVVHSTSTTASTSRCYS